MRPHRGKEPDPVAIIGEIAREVEGKCMITVTDEYGEIQKPCPPVNFVFGNAAYIRERLQELSFGQMPRYPLIALHVPITEQRGDRRYFCKLRARILIAMASDKEWSNEQRQLLAFENVLRPIYRAFLEGMRKDPRIDTGYGGEILHEYSENYSYGRYGAYTQGGEKLPDPIDAIDIAKLELTIKNQKCS